MRILKINHYPLEVHRFKSRIKFEKHRMIGWKTEEGRREQGTGRREQGGGRREQGGGNKETVRE